MVKGYVERNIKAIDPKIPFKAVHASGSCFNWKAIRAEPISALYEQGKVHHFGTFLNLKPKCVSGFQE